MLLLHGWPYDIHSYADVAPPLAAAGYRVLVPYLRGYGATRFVSDDVPRNGQQSVLAVDAVALMDALGVDEAIVQNTLGYSPVQAGLRFLPLTLVSFAVALLTGRLIGKVAMRVLLGVAMVAAAAGLASMAHLTATSTWLVLLPGFSLAGIGLGITSTGLASAALSAVDPARAGMAAGLTNTLRQRRGQWFGGPAAQTCTKCRWPTAASASEHDRIPACREDRHIDPDTAFHRTGGKP